MNNITTITNDIIENPQINPDYINDFLQMAEDYQIELLMDELNS